MSLRTRATLYGYKILGHSSKKGDVLKMLRFSLVTVAEQTRLGNFEDKLSRVFSFLGHSMYFGILGTQKNRLDERVRLSAQNT